MSATTPVLVLIAAYLAVGLAVGARLHRAGHPPGAAAAASVAWPLFLGALAGELPALAVGPYHERIAAAFAALAAALLEPAAAAVAAPEELAALRASLQVIDGRIGMVDRLLADPALREDPLGERLRDARAHAAAEVEAVLHGLTQLRVQVGLLALLGDAVPVRARMRELGARVKAIEEIALA